MHEPVSAIRPEQVHRPFGVVEAVPCERRPYDEAAISRNPTRSTRTWHGRQSPAAQKTPEFECCCAQSRETGTGFIAKSSWLPTICRLADDRVNMRVDSSSASRQSW